MNERFFVHVLSVYDCESPCLYKCTFPCYSSFSDSDAALCALANDVKSIHLCDLNLKPFVRLLSI